MASGPSRMASWETFWGRALSSVGCSSLDKESREYFWSTERLNLEIKSTLKMSSKLPEEYHRNFWLYRRNNVSYYSWDTKKSHICKSLTIQQSLEPHNTVQKRLNGRVETCDAGLKFIVSVKRIFVKCTLGL